MRGLTPSGAPTPVFRFALAEVSGECSPRREMEGAEGGGVCPAYAPTDSFQSHGTGRLILATRPGREQEDAHEQ